MQTDSPDYAAIRRRVARSLIFRLTFFLHLIFFLLIMYVLWLSVGRTFSGEDDFGALIATFILGNALLFHGALAYNVFGRIVDRQTRRELERADLSEKPKRKRLELTEDGELVELADETGDEERYATER